MKKISVKTEKSSNFASEANSKPVMIIIESKRKKLETLKKDQRIKTQTKDD